MSRIEKLINVLEMANFRPQETGLPMVIWLQPKTGKEKHGARLKVQTSLGDKVNPSEFISVTIDEQPGIVGTEKDLLKLTSKNWKLVQQFIKMNKEGLMKLWNDEISPLEFGKNYLKKV